MPDVWVSALQMSYRYNGETGEMVFSDGVKYTIEEAVQLSKGRLSDDDLMAIHQVKKVFDGEIDSFEKLKLRMSKHQREVPDVIPVSDMRPVLQKRARKRRGREVDPGQRVLDL